jgi:exodeoxyribonuclease-3
MRVITANVNGLRAAAKKGFFDWLATQEADLVCLQEVRAPIHKLDDKIYCPENYHCTYVEAKKPGYSGVALYSRVKPKTIVNNLGFPLCDEEGRYVEYNFDNLTVASIYFPSGSSDEKRQVLKYHFLEQFEDVLNRLVSSNAILCGDWNIAHKEIDLSNWKANQKSSGFLPEERAWLDKVFGKMSWIDAFRVVEPRPEQYTWWSSRTKAWDKNIGWRIDYQVVSPSLGSCIERAFVYRDQQFSDHAPVVVDYNYSIL